MVIICLKKSGEEKNMCVYFFIYMCLFVCMICVYMCMAFEKWNVKNKISFNNQKQHIINNKNKFKSYTRI